MSDEQVTALVSRYLETEDELAGLGKRIEASGHDLAVVFIDLAGSTELKHRTTVPRWLGYVFRFLELTAKLASDYSGVVVKRIGDELMVTFGDVENADAFIAAAAADTGLSHHAFKIAADFGTAFEMSFRETNVLDPYGAVVDRAARIAKIAGPSTALASSTFVKALRNPSSYSSLGRFPMRGIPETQEIFLRMTTPLMAEGYLSSLLEVLNNELTAKPRFRFVMRRFSEDDFHLGDSMAHPFLVRELLVLPLLPYDFEGFVRLHKAEPESAREMLGQLVEWEAGFASSEYDHDSKIFRVMIASVSGDYALAKVLLPKMMADSVAVLKRGDRVRIRAVLMGVNGLFVLLDYADIQLAV